MEKEPTNKRGKGLVSLVVVSILIVATLSGVFIYRQVTKEKQQTAEEKQPTKTRTTYEDKGEQCEEDYAGLALEEATLLAEQHGYCPLVAKTDGSLDKKIYMYTSESCYRNIYFDIENGIVIKGYFPRVINL
jgi:hypothetical protein